jgi:hypothetical protein
VPTLKTLRAGTNTRTAEPILVEGQRGVLARKVLDSGSSIYWGPLDNLLVDRGGRGERLHLRERSPLRDGIHRSDSTLARGTWKIRAVTATLVWSERLAPDQVVFRYEASVEDLRERSAVRGEARRRHGPRRWI